MLKHKQDCGLAVKHGRIHVLAFIPDGGSETHHHPGLGRGGFSVEKVELASSRHIRITAF